MQKPLILITGATGKTGFATAVALRAKGWPVRALVRQINKGTLKLEQLGVELVEGDLFNQAQVSAAMQGVSRAYFCPPWHPNMIQSVATFLAAAKSAGVQAIVALSQWLASPDAASLATRQNWLMEQMLEMTPAITHTIIRPGYFADNYLNYNLLNFAAHLGIYADPYGQGRNAPPSNEDIGRCIAAALMEPAKYAGQKFRPTGPELLSIPQMAAVIAKVYGRKIRIMPMPNFMLQKAQTLAGMAPFVQMQVAAYNEEQKAGSFEAGAPNQDVKFLTGNEPEDFATIVRRYARSPEQVRSVGNTIRALYKFVKIGFLPATSFRSIDKKIDLPAQESIFAVKSAIWQNDHLMKGVNHVQPQTNLRAL